MFSNIDNNKNLINNSAPPIIISIKHQIIFLHTVVYCILIKKLNNTFQLYLWVREMLPIYFINVHFVLEGSCLCNRAGFGSVWMCECVLDRSCTSDCCHLAVSEQQLSLWDVSGCRLRLSDSHTGTRAALWGGGGFRGGGRRRFLAHRRKRRWGSLGFGGERWRWMDDWFSPSSSWATDITLRVREMQGVSEWYAEHIFLRVYTDYPYNHTNRKHSFTYKSPKGAIAATTLFLRSEKGYKN